MSRAMDWTVKRMEASVPTSSAYPVIQRNSAVAKSCNKYCGCLALQSSCSFELVSRWDILYWCPTNFAALPLAKHARILGVVLLRRSRQADRLVAVTGESIDGSSSSMLCVGQRECDLPTRVRVTIMSLQGSRRPMRTVVQCAYPDLSGLYPPATPVRLSYLG